MPRLIRLPSGTRIAPDAIRLIDAPDMRKPWIDSAGTAWPAMIVIETKHQVYRQPCASHDEAVALREHIARQCDAVDDEREAREARFRPDARTGDVRNGDARPSDHGLATLLGRPAVNRNAALPYAELPGEIAERGAP